MSPHPAASLPRGAVTPQGAGRGPVLIPHLHQVTRREGRRLSRWGQWPDTSLSLRWAPQARLRGGTQRHRKQRAPLRQARTSASLPRTVPGTGLSSHQPRRSAPPAARGSIPSHPRSRGVLGSVGGAPRHAWSGRVRIGGVTLGKEWGQPPAQKWVPEGFPADPVGPQAWGTPTPPLRDHPCISHQTSVALRLSPLPGSGLVASGKSHQTTWRGMSRWQSTELGGPAGRGQGGECPSAEKGGRLPRSPVPGGWRVLGTQSPCGSSLKG